MKPFKKHVLIAKDEHLGKVFATIKWTGERLSICAVEGPTRGGNARGGCGQVRPAVYTDPLIDLERFNEVWNRWHLNDMRAGTPKQEEALREAENAGWEHKSYDGALAKLAELGLKVDGGYVYGSAWNHEDVPEDVVEYLDSLPSNDTLPVCWA